jgi:soluble lytic murein transglycosylase-like protein
VPSPSRGEEILYYVQGDDVVFTNTPSRRDVKPVPGSVRKLAQRATALPATIYDPFIDRVAEENGLDPALIKAVALVESGFNPKAVSPKGAQGLMQLMPATASRYGVSNPHDPYQSLRGGAQHLRDLLDEFSGDVTLALAAYNAGSGAVRRHGGVPAYKETREYVAKVERNLGGTRRVARDSVGSSAKAQKVSLRLAPDGTILLTN